jgi:hypothetical protein
VVSGGGGEDIERRMRGEKRKEGEGERRETGWRMRGRKVRRRISR